MAYGNPNLLPAVSYDFETGSHGWAAGSNTTLAVVSGQFLTGAQSLRFTATAAGSVTGTTPRILVTAGAEYVTRTPIRTNTATAGKVATLTVTWFNAASGGTSLGTSVATLSLTAQSGWFAVNYPAVCAVAPVGALSATVTLAVSGLAAAETINTDDVYFGVGQNRAGNAYGLNTSSIEQDTSGWKIDSGTLDRSAATLFSGSGFYALNFTSPGAGTFDIRTNSFIGVTPGNTYVAYAAVLAPVVATTWLHEFRWYDGSSNEVGTREQRTYTIAANSIVRISVVGTAPVGAVTAKQFIRPVATAAAQSFMVEDAYFGTAPNPAGNLLAYDEYSTESKLPSWTITGGVPSQYYIVSNLTDGFYALRVTPNAPGIIQAQLDRLVPVTPGTTYQVKATLFRHNADTAQVITSGVRMRVDWFDGAGNLVLADNPDQFYPVSQPDLWWAQINSETRTCPAGAAFARVGFELDSTSPLVDFWAIDNITFMVAAAEYTLATNNDTGCVTLTVGLVQTPNPNNAAITIKRMDEDGRASSLRGYGQSFDLAAYPYSTMVIEDYEAPLGSRVWYSISWTTADGTSTSSRMFTQLVSAPVLDDADYVWFKSPGLPALNTRVMMEAPPKWSRAARSARFDVVGRKNPIHQTGIRAGRTSSISVLVWDSAANELFDSLLDSGLPALIQAMPGYGLDGNLYLSIGDVDVEPLDPDAREEGWRWTLSVTEVDRPGGGLQGSAGITWQTIFSNYSTWEDVFNSHATWADVLTKG